MADEPLGPLAISYPLVLVAAGLWFSVRLVAVTTLVPSWPACVGLLVLRPRRFWPDALSADLHRRRQPYGDRFPLGAL